MVWSGAPQTILLVLKSGYLDQILISRLQQLNVKLELQIKGWLATQQIDYQALQYPHFACKATIINEDKIFLYMAAFYHYDLNAASLQRFCGWRSTGDHRCQEELLVYLLVSLHTPRASVCTTVAGLHAWHPGKKITASTTSTHAQNS